MGVPFLEGVPTQVGMLRLRGEDRFALLTAALSTTCAGAFPKAVEFTIIGRQDRITPGLPDSSFPIVMLSITTTALSRHTRARTPLILEKRHFALVEKRY